jgi:RNA polymerase sigma factor (sigma-70 family)
MDRAQLERELETLHKECWGWALACCRRDPELADDALQSAYLRVLSGRARFEGRSSVRTWVFGVIRVTSMEEQRRRRSWLVRKVGLETTIDVEDPTARADANAESSEQSATLLAALATVSPRQREALQLVFYHGMTIEEAAKVMNVSIGSARTHYERGKKALAVTLANSRPR